jgi:spermidine/putrescine transport system permease protein
MGVEAVSARPGRRKRLRAPGYVVAAPSIVWYLLFFVVPIALIVWYSFGVADITQKPVPVDMSSLSLENYRRAFDETFFRTFKNTLRTALIATTLCTLIGFPVAYFLAFKVRERWRGILLALVIVPSFTSFLIRTIAWRIPLARNGWVSDTLQDWGILGAPIGILETRSAVQLALVYNYLGFMILPLFVALDRIEDSMREASKDLGASRWHTFTQVTLPLAAPGIAAGIMLTYIPMCGDFVTAAVLGGAKGNMIGAMIDSTAGEGRDWALASAMAVMMIGAVLVSLIAAALVVWALRGLIKWRRGLPNLALEAA